MLQKLIITECPRDGIQGLKQFIPTQNKVDYINVLLRTGFDIIDFGSFVSPNAIPQLRDTAEVLEKLDLSDTNTQLMAIVANKLGGDTAASFSQISYLAFPYSVSKTFLRLNINSTFDESRKLIDYFQNICFKNYKKLKVYLTMAFGNPYGDISNPEIVYDHVKDLNKMGIRYITLSDITGVSDKEGIKVVYEAIIADFPEIEFGFHLHTTAETWYAKVDSAYLSGCRSFDAVINGMGGCPMTNYEMVGNLNTIDLLEYLEQKTGKQVIDKKSLLLAVNESNRLIGGYH